MFESCQLWQDSFFKEIFNIVRRFTDNVDNYSKAAGIMPLASDTGRVLLGLRPEGRFSTIGGYLAWGERFSEGAMREFIEETMYTGPIILLKGYHYQSPVKNFEYANFIGMCPTEFEPQLDEENEDAEWFTMSQLYAGRLPLHQDFEEFLIEAKPMLEELMKSLGHLND